MFAVASSKINKSGLRQNGPHKCDELFLPETDAFTTGTQIRYPAAVRNWPVVFADRQFRITSSNCSFEYPKHIVIPNIKYYP